MTRPDFDCFGTTDPGKTRAANEDHFVIASMRKSVRIRHTSLDDPLLAERLGGEEAHLLAVADGVGGRPGGQLASSTAVSGLLEYVGRVTGCYHSMDVDEEQLFLDRLEEGIRNSHERLHQEYGDSERAPATTLTMVVLVSSRAYIVHVGDSRAYYLRKGRLRQITRDQTIGEYMMDMGAWTEAQAARAAAASALASVIGGSELNPSVGLIDLEPGDVLLLCTDGLTKHVSNEGIAEVLGRSASTEAMSRELVSRALEGGGSDNVTVVVARLSAATT